MPTLRDASWGQSAEEIRRWRDASGWTAGADLEEGLLGTVGFSSGAGGWPPVGLPVPTLRDASWGESAAEIRRWRDASSWTAGAGPEETADGWASAPRL